MCVSFQIALETTLLPYTNNLYIDQACMRFVFNNLTRSSSFLCAVRQGWRWSRVDYILLRAPPRVTPAIANENWGFVIETLLSSTKYEYNRVSNWKPFTNNKVQNEILRNKMARKLMKFFVKSKALLCVCFTDCRWHHEQVFHEA